jgi:hypothetical protein
MPAGKRNVSGNRSVLAEREGGNRHVVEEIDDQIKTLAAEARQNFYHADAPGERPVDGIDDQRDAEPDEHPLPRAARRGNQRKQRKRGACRREKVDRRGAQALAHAPSVAERARGRKQ